MKIIPRHCGLRSYKLRFIRILCRNGNRYCDGIKSLKPDKRVSTGIWTLSVLQFSHWKSNGKSRYFEFELFSPAYFSAYLYVSTPLDANVPRLRSNLGIQLSRL